MQLAPFRHVVVAIVLALVIALGAADQRRENLIGLDITRHRLVELGKGRLLPGGFAGAANLAGDVVEAVEPVGNVALAARRPLAHVDPAAIALPGLDGAQGAVHQRGIGIGLDDRGLQIGAAGFRRVRRDRRAGLGEGRRGGGKDNGSGKGRGTNQGGDGHGVDLLPRPPPERQHQVSAPTT